MNSPELDAARRTAHRWCTLLNVAVTMRLPMSALNWIDERAWTAVKHRAAVEAEIRERHAAQAHRTAVWG